MMPDRPMFIEEAARIALKNRIEITYHGEPAMVTWQVANGEDLKALNLESDQILPPVGMVFDINGNLLEAKSINEVRQMGISDSAERDAYVAVLFQDPPVDEFADN